MTDQEKREKVIKGLECCIGYGIEDTPGCEDCPYNDMGDTCDRIRPLYDDALALLKAREAVEPTIGRCEEYDGHDSWWYQCGKCNTPIDYHDSYCRNCGQAVKWE